MRRLFVPANDDAPTLTWLDFKADGELFEWALKYARGLVWSIRHSPCERSQANFIWFFRFEKSFEKQDGKQLQEKPHLKII